MVDANQIWDVNQAIDWMKHLIEFKLFWIEEPTSPDDVIGHATISKALRYNFNFITFKIVIKFYFQFIVHMELV